MVGAKPAVAQARRYCSLEPLVAGFFHHSDFTESGKGVGAFKRDSLEQPLQRFGAQVDVDVTTP